MKYAIMLSALLLIPGICKAETACPWINTATAAGILEGPVNLETQNTEGNGNICEFTYHDGTMMHSLRIAVHDIQDRKKDMMTNEAQCRSRIVPLKGIGNDAMLCSVDVHSSRGEQVVGWVRNRIFIVRIDANDASMTRKVLQEKARMAAEQVAGNLF
jgi:hypothetical protein